MKVFGTDNLSHWRTLLHRVQTSDMTAYAAALAYNFLFALFPLLLFLTALLGFLHLPTLAHVTRQTLGPVLPNAVVSTVLNSLHSAEKGRNAGVLSIGALGFIWGMSGAFRQLIDAINHAYGFTPPTRAWWKTYLLSVVTGLLVGTLIVAATAVGAGGTAMIQWLLSQIWHLPHMTWVSELLRWTTLVALVLFILAIIYSALPDKRQPLKLFSPGALVALVVWILVSAGFSIYTAHFHSYNKTYGSLGTIILLMLYLYLVALSLLLGAEVNATFAALPNEPTP